MNKLLVLLLAGCCYSVSGIKLENICANETFGYQGYKVNSFYRLKQNLTLGRISDYLLDRSVTCDLKDFNENKTALKEFFDIKIG